MHPYYPKSLVIPKYASNSLDVAEILSYFFGVMPVILLLSWFLLAKAKLELTVSRKLILCWFVLCGCVHTVLEGYFAVYHTDIAGRMDFLAQVWKEYAKGDSRYLISDSFIVGMETVTAFIEGPLSFLTVWAFVTLKPYRYLLQLSVSGGQLYGCVLYFYIEWLDGFTHGPLWHPIYFWFYFVFMNVLWIIIPAILIIDAWRNMSASQSAVDCKKKRI